jgi:hypothetical protein
MPCYHPIECYKLHTPLDNGRVLVFDKPPTTAYQPIKINCGHCWGCRLDYSRDWSVRIMHEAKMHDHNYFLTLTYDDEHLPQDMSLHGDHLRRFFKRLREQTGKKFRYYAAGEYGEKYRRPHYHLCLFGLNLDDKVVLKQVHGGHKLYTSDTISSAWDFGFHSIGTLTLESAAYVARYVVKKRVGKGSFTAKVYNDETQQFEEVYYESVSDYYETVDYDTGEVQERFPEFCRMSRRPGIGQSWIDKFAKDVLSTGSVVLENGKQTRIPRYYLEKLSLKYPEETAKLKAQKRIHARENEVTSDRLATMEKCQIERAKKLIRPYNDET